MRLLHRRKKRIIGGNKSLRYYPIIAGKTRTDSSSPTGSGNSLANAEYTLSLVIFELDLNQSREECMPAEPKWGRVDGKRGKQLLWM